MELGMHHLKDQFLGDLPERPADMTRTSVSVLSRAALSFFPRTDPRFVNLFHNFEPCEVLSEEEERGTPSGGSLESADVIGAESDDLLVLIVRVGMANEVGGGLCSGPDFGSSSVDMMVGRSAVSFLGGDDNPARTGVVGPGVDGPDDSSLSSCGCPLSLTCSSSSSNTVSSGRSAS